MNQLPTLQVQTVALQINSQRWRYKQLLSTSTPNARDTNSSFLNQPLRWWYILTLEVQPYAGGTDIADQSSIIVTAVSVDARVANLVDILLDLADFDSV